MPSPPHSPPRVWFGSWPFRYILLCPPLGSVVGRSVRVRHWRVFWGWITSALTPGLSLLSFCRLVLGFVFWCFFALSASLLYVFAVCIIDISVDQLCGSLRESE